MRRYLAENLDRKLILISAAAGYGKTSLLVDFSHAAGLPVCWYRVETVDADAPVFFEHLMAALGQQFPNLGQRTRSMLYGDEKLDLEAAVGSLVNEIVEGVQEPFLLVLDDYQNLDDAVAVNAAMDLFLHYLPDTCRVILCTRTLPRKLTLTRLAAEGQVAGLGHEHLRFTREEIRQLAAHLHQQDLTAPQIAELDRLSEGWAAALVLASDRLAQGAPTLQRSPGANRGQLFDFLAHEVLARQSPAVQSFLIRSSILETLTPALCNAVLEHPDSATALRELEEQNLFLVPFDAEGTWYRYHPLFQEFLQTQLANEPALDVTGLHRRAAAWYRSADLAEQVVHHLLGAGDFEPAADAMLERVNDMAAGGRWRLIVHWVEALPPPTVRARPLLLERLGVALVQLGDIREGIEALDEAVAAFRMAEDQAGLASALVQRGPALRLLGRLGEAEADSQEALKLVLDSRGVAAGEAHRNLGACQALRGQLGQARQELEAALACFEATGPATLVAHTHADLAALYQLAGDSDAALRHSEAARRHYEQVGNLGAMAMAMNNGAVALHAQGRFEEARALLAEAADRARTAGVMRTEALVLVGLGDVLADLDAAEPAAAQYEAGLELARQVGEMPLVVYGLAGWAEALRLAGRPAEARGLLAQAEPELAAYHYPYESAHLDYVRGTLALERLELTVARSHFEAAAAAFHGIGAPREEVRVVLHQVALAQRSADPVRADHAWRTALALLEALDYPEALAPTVARLPEVQARLPRAPGRLRRTLQAARRREGPAVPAPQLAPFAALAATAPALTVLALGPTEIRRGGQRLEPGAWQTTVARDLFLYLVDRPDGATRLELMAVFWPESPETRARGALHSTVYRARSAIGRDWLLAAGDRYVVPRSADLFYDVHELERCLARAGAELDTSLDKGAGTDCDAGRIRALEAGLALVRGSYLEGVSEEWCHARREALDLAIVDALIELASAYVRSGAAGDAVMTYRRAIERDPLREDAHRGLMRAYAEGGDRTRALVQYERLVTVLQDELGTLPNATTVALELAIRSEQALPAE